MTIKRDYLAQILVFLAKMKHVVVKIFGNGVKIAWNGQNQEGAMCTLHAYVSMLNETCARVMCTHHTNT